jgi:hypothetical protein
MADYIPVKSNSKTVNLCPSTPFNSFKISLLTLWGSFLVVATTVSGVVRRRYRVKWRPIPLLAGVTSDHGAIVLFLGLYFDILPGGNMEHGTKVSLMLNITALGKWRYPSERTLSDWFQVTHIPISHVVLQDEQECSCIYQNNIESWLYTKVVVVVPKYVQFLLSAVCLSSYQ